MWVLSTTLIQNNVIYSYNLVPYLFPENSACSKNPPSSIIFSNTGLVT